MPLNVVVADDHHTIRAGIRAYLEVRGVKVVAESADADHVELLLDTTACDALLTDFTMPSQVYPDGFAYLDAIRSSHAELPIVIATITPRRSRLRRMAAVAGVSIVDKTEPLEEVLTALRHAAEGRTYFSPALERLLDDAHRPASGLLTHREQQVLELIGMGMNVSEIAAMLDRHITTVSTQKRSLMNKLTLRNDRDIVEYLRDRHRWGVDSFPEQEGS
ncbi:response regulator transcription factor [Pinirhizobacter sp.]|jgi:two-component system capsular synthesis response regulator RcsB|uniref:response regulator transcription factor n=1 Tax=Pinirhizobacter sp. TaxID=2950432 RepID=UPI002F40415D